MEVVAAFMAGIVTCRMFMRPIPKQTQDDMRTVAIATIHMSETQRKVLIALEALERNTARMAANAGKRHAN